MIYITIWRNTENEIFEYSVEGHSGFGTSGNDIYCAGVSTLTQSAVLGLKNVAKVRVREENAYGYLKVSLLDHATEKSNTILETMLLGLKSLRSINNHALELKEKKIK